MHQELVSYQQHATPISPSGVTDEQQQRLFLFQGSRVSYQNEAWEVWNVHSDGAITLLRLAEERNPRFVRIKLREVKELGEIKSE